MSNHGSFNTYNLVPNCNTALDIQNNLTLNELNLSIYPNPTSDQLFLQGEGLEDLEFKFSLTDLAGNTLYTGIVNSGLEIMIPNKPSRGIYILNLEGVDIKATFKVIYN